MTTTVSAETAFNAAQKTLNYAEIREAADTLLKSALERLQAASGGEAGTIRILRDNATRDDGKPRALTIIRYTPAADSDARYHQTEAARHSREFSLLIDQNLCSHISASMKADVRQYKFDADKMHLVLEKLAAWQQDVLPEIFQARLAAKTAAAAPAL